jgi:hypothetical protein
MLEILGRFIWTTAFTLPLFLYKTGGSDVFILCLVKRNFYFFLSVQHPNSRLENNCYFFYLPSATQ